MQKPGLSKLIERRSQASMMRSSVMDGCSFMVSQKGW